jgi:ketosteroid isomerase-like protein
MDGWAVATAADETVTLVLRCFDAYARGDVEQAVSYLHPDIAWIEPASFLNGGQRHGRAAVAQYFRESKTLWATLESHPTPYRAAHAVVMVVHVNGRLVDGRTVDATVADVFTVENGQITRMVAYADPIEAFAAIVPGPVG